MEPRSRLMAWAGLEQESLLRDAIAAGRLELVAVGGPAPGVAAPLADRLGAAAIGDLRQAAQSGAVDVIWLADPEPIPHDALRTIQELDVLTVVSEPQARSLAELAPGEGASAQAWLVPTMRQSPGFIAATESMAAFGRVECVAAAFRSGTGEGTVFARLYDAIDVVHRLCGAAQSIDACLAGSPVPDSLRRMRGHMTANLRFGDQRCAAVIASDSGGAWSRTLTLLGERGSLSIDDGGFAWTDRDGTVVDDQRSRPRLSPGTLAGGQIRALLDRQTAAGPPPDAQAIYAMAEAARLSCRTGQAEAPPRMLEIFARP